MRIINNIHNLGVASTRNVILDNATGEFIFFADPDDWIDAEKKLKTGCCRSYKCIHLSSPIMEYL